MNPFLLDQTLSPRESKIAVTTMVLLGALGNALYGVVTLNRFAMVVGIIGFAYGFYTSHQDFSE